jgi:hypothetical protein
MTADPIIVRQSRAQRDGLFGVLVAVFAAAFARGFAGAQTAGGRIAACVFTGVVIAVLAWFWARTVRQHCRLEVSGEAITLTAGRDQPVILSRQQGDELLVVSLGSGRFRSRGLMVRGGSGTIPLHFFSLSEVRRQCAARGWRFAQ